MATPRKKTTHSKKRHRYMAIIRNKLRKMGKYFNLVKCTNCGEFKRNHHICPKCNSYNGRTYTSKFSKKQDGKTVIKA